MKTELPTEFLKFLSKLDDENKESQLIQTYAGFPRESDKIFGGNTNKKKVKTKKRNKVKEFFISLKINFLAFWSKYVSTPFNSRKERIEKEAETKNIIKAFEQQFNVSHSDIKSVMDEAAKVHTQTDEDYLVEKLHEARIKLQLYNRKSPHFYEPEICEIHNENPDRLSHPTLKDVINNDNKVMREEFDGINTKNNKTKADWVWMTRG